MIRKLQVRFSRVEPPAHVGIVALHPKGGNKMTDRHLRPVLGYCWYVGSVWGWFANVVVQVKR